MKNKWLFVFAIIFINCISACNNEVKKDKDNTGASSNGKIRNGISIQENGLHVEQAFLLKDDGTLIDDNNKIQVGERVSLRLIMHGWEVKDDKVYPEASEKIATNDGQIFLDEQTLFSTSLPGGTTLENAEAITLYATISRVDKLYDYFLVSFKVRDKTSNKSVSGSYKLYL